MKVVSLALLLSAAAFLANASPNKAGYAQPRGEQFALLFTTGPGWDANRSPNEQRHFNTHSANLRRLRDAGVIAAGGRFGQYGLIVVRAPNADSAHRMLAPDSSLAVGTFKVQVDKWSTIYDGTIQR